MSSAQDRIHEAALRLFAERGATQVGISDLADAAGLARGTVYKNVGSVDALFEQVAGRLTTEMTDRIGASTSAVEDPAERLALGIRFFVRRAHEEPLWGRFINRFGVSAPSLQGLWNGPPMQELRRGVAIERYSIRPEQVSSAAALVAGGVLAAMLLVLEGHRTWRDAGADLTELVLRALGVPPEEARRFGLAELPPLLPTA